MNTKFLDNFMRVVIALAFALGMVGAPAAVVQAEGGNPVFGVRWPHFQIIEGWGWTPGATVIIEVYSPSYAPLPVYTGSATVEPFWWDPNNTNFQHRIEGYYPKVGDRVVVSDGVTTKEHIIKLIAIIGIDPVGDLVYGIADPGERVTVWTYNNSPMFTRYAYADANGNWVVNYSIPGEQDDEQDIVDIRYGQANEAWVNDEDGDGTNVAFGFNHRFSVQMWSHEVNGESWIIGASVMLTIDDPTTTQLPDYTKTQTVNALNGSVQFRLWEDGFTLQPGMIVTMTDGVITKTHVATNLTVTNVDPNTDTVSGHGNPNQDVWVDVWCDGDCPSRHIVADANGDWLADFSVPGDENWENNTYDIQYGSRGEVRQCDDDWDCTQYGWNAPPWPVWVAPDSVPFVVGVGWGDVNLKRPDYEQTTMIIANLLWEPLFRVSEDGALIKAMVQDYSVSADERVYTFTLRDDAYWSDEVPVTAQHFVDGFLRLLHPDTATDYRFFLYPIVGAATYANNPGTDPSTVGLAALNEHTLQITLIKPTSYFLQTLAFPGMFPVRADLIDRYGDTWVEPGKLAGNGPYRLVERDPSHILVEKNPYFHNADQIMLEQIGFAVISDEEELLAAYRRGEVDAMLGIPNSALNDPSLDPDRVDFNTPGVQYISLNIAQPPTDNLLVRKALASAINRQSILTLGPYGLQEATGIIPPALPGYQGDSVGYPFNPSLAQDLLAQAGYPGGAGFPEIVLYSRRYNAIIETVAEQWRTVLNIPVHVVYRSDLYGYIRDVCQVNPADCSLNGYRMGWLIDYFDAYNILGDMLVGNDVLGGFGPIGWHNPRYNELLELSLAESDPAQRILYYQEAETIIVEEDAAVIPLIYTKGIGLVKAGFTTDDRGLFPYFDLWGNVDTDGDGRHDLLDPCPGDANNTCDPNGSAASIIGASGGALATENDRVEIMVPANALQGNTVISVTDMGGGYEVATYQGTMNVFQSYSIQPHDTRFDQPVTITFRWADADNDGIVDGTSLSETKILIIKDGLILTPSCAVNPNCNMTANELSLQITDLSLFELAVPIDTTPPVITPVITGTQGENGWYTSAVTVAWQVSDGESEVTSMNGCGMVTLTADTAGESFTCSAENSARLSSTETVTVKIDQTPPVITWLGNINNGDSFYYGFVPPESTCTAVDPTSGLAGSCVVSGYQITPGTYTLFARTSDHAGNQSVQSRQYTVLGWTLRGFYQPVDMNGIYNLVKGGSTVPLKFEIFAGSTELTDTVYVKSLSYAETSCNANAITDEIELTATGGTSLRYDVQSGQFIYNWKAPSTANKCYRVTIITQDGSALLAYFKLK